MGLYGWLGIVGIVVGAIVALSIPPIVGAYLAPARRRAIGVGFGLGVIVSAAVPYVWGSNVLKTNDNGAAWIFGIARMAAVPALLLSGGIAMRRARSVSQ